ncbi:MAG: hypothetical protein ACFFAS_18010 [Promethearchaeota archaeon]
MKKKIVYAGIISCVLVITVISVGLILTIPPPGNPNISPQGIFSSEWDTTNLGASNSNQVRLPLESGGTTILRCIGAMVLTTTSLSQASQK